MGRYTDELARALALHEVHLRRYAVALGGNTPPHTARWRCPAKLAQAAWRRFDRPAIERLTGRVDVVHATNFVLPALGSAPGVVTVHDLSFLRDDVFPGGERLRDLVPWSIERAAKVIVPAAAIGAELTSHYGLDPGRVAVTPEGVAPGFFGASPLADSVLGRRGIPGPYALAVGTIEPRKNLVTLLRAWTKVSQRLSGWSLVIAGPKGWGPELPETPGVILTGYVADETLPGLMAGAGFFCYPSLYEGFGLPPLEAMAAGTPVVAGRYSVAEEVLGDGALLVDPGDEARLGDALERIATDEALRRRLVVGGRARAASYTWTRTAKATMEVYRSITGGLRDDGSGAHSGGPPSEGGS